MCAVVLMQICTNSTDLKGSIEYWMMFSTIVLFYCCCQDRQRLHWVSIVCFKQNKSVLDFTLSTWSRRSKPSQSKQPASHGSICLLWLLVQELYVREWEKLNCLKSKCSSCFTVSCGNLFWILKCLYYHYNGWKLLCFALGKTGWKNDSAAELAYYPFLIAGHSASAYFGSGLMVCLEPSSSLRLP